MGADTTGFPLPSVSAETSLTVKTSTQAFNCTNLSSTVQSSNAASLHLPRSDLDHAGERDVSIIKLFSNDMGLSGFRGVGAGDGTEG